VRYECLVIIHSLIEFYSHFIYRKRDIEHLLTLTDFFTWEELPTRDPDTGCLTKAGCIPIIQDLIKKVTIVQCDQRYPDDCAHFDDP